MQVRIILLFVTVSLMAPFFSLESALAQPFPIPDGSKCSECGMSIDGNSRFASETLTNDGKRLFFCDIGDMLFHFRSSREKINSAYVRDYSSGEWTDASKASYVFNIKFNTPMSWKIAAFSSEAEAKKWGNPVDFNGAFKLLK